VAPHAGAAEAADSKPPSLHRRKSESDVSSASGARALALLALLLALAAAGFSGWLYLQQEARRQLLDEREARLDEEVERIAATAGAARESVGDAIEASRQATLEVSQRLAEERSRNAELLARQQSAIAAVEAAQRSQRQQLLEISSTDRVDWTLAEAEYLLRLAYQRLLMAKDVRSALALLASADAILRELDDTGLYPAREAIARDMAALRAVPTVDVEGTWLRLQALAGRVDSLILFELPSLEQPRQEIPAQAGWRERLQLGFRAALQKISDYLVIRRRDEPFEALMDPQWEQLVRQNLRMQIAQAQAALLAGNPALYQASLGATRRWLAEFFDFNQTEVKALEAELAELTAVKVSAELPDIGGSLEAVRDAIDLRHAVRGG
jgi:uroporphyrin-3 C-methyltransferase